MHRTALDLIDKLIACWAARKYDENYCLTVLAPLISQAHRSQPITYHEWLIACDLRQRLSTDEWQQFPAILATRMEARRQEQAERARQEAVAREEAKRGEAEQRMRHLADVERLAEERARQQREAQEEAKKRREAEAAQEARKTALVKRMHDIFESDFLSADRVRSADPDAQLLKDDDYEALKAEFVQEWALRALQTSLDAEQARAIAVTAGDVQVVARAGSGKTRTLVTKALFLQQHCGVAASELLLQAFNKRAADEMKERLSGVVAKNLPHVMTFHALAHALVHPDEQMLFDDVSAAHLGLSREVQDIIDEHVRSSNHAIQIRDLMLAHFREDWERIVGGGFELRMDQFLAYRRALPRETFKGDYVKSFGEKVIANALFEHAIEYRYERNFRWNGVNYRPDFVIPVGSAGGVIIEYFGLEGDPDYDEMSEEKRRFWATKDQWKLLEYSPRDLAKGGEDAFVQLVLRELQAAGIRSRRRTEEEIWELIRRRALDRFTEAMRTFVARCRKLNLALDDLATRVATHAASSVAEELFLNVALSVYEGYLERLSRGSKEDFDGLMWRSSSVVRGGGTQFVRDKGREHGDVAQMRFVLIDEFQDFSPMFFELIDAVRSVNRRAEFFCVGDDWQAINGFAGSDLRFYSDFPRYFKGSSRCYIRTNYRSPRRVVEVGNSVMRGRGPAAEPKNSSLDGIVWLCNLDDFVPSATEQARHNGDEVTPAVLRLVKYFLDRGQDVAMLSRRRALPWYVNYAGQDAAGSADLLARFLEHVRAHLPEEDRRRVTASTTHQFKGLEQAAVIILDGVARSYPLVHPNWVFLRMFGDTLDRIEAEERRLFYVATTRAKESLALLTETRVQSPYVREILDNTTLTPLLWTNLPPAPSLDAPHVELRVFNAYEVREELKRCGFRWHVGGRYWRRAVPAEGFSFDALLQQPWARDGIAIEVYSETAQLLSRRTGNL